MQDAELCDVWKGYHEAEARELGYARLLTNCCIFSRTLQATAIQTAHAISPPKEENRGSVCAVANTLSSSIARQAYGHIADALPPFADVNLIFLPSPPVGISDPQRVSISSRPPAPAASGPHPPQTTRPSRPGPSCPGRPPAGHHSLPTLQDPPRSRSAARSRGSTQPSTAATPPALRHLTARQQEQYLHRPPIVQVHPLVGICSVLQHQQLHYLHAYAGILALRVVRHRHGRHLPRPPGLARARLGSVRSFVRT